MEDPTAVFIWGMLAGVLVVVMVGCMVQAYREYRNKPDIDQHKALNRACRKLYGKR